MQQLLAPGDEVAGVDRESGRVGGDEHGCARRPPRERVVDERSWIAKRELPAGAIEERARIGEDVVPVRRPPGRARHRNRPSTDRRLQ